MGERSAETVDTGDVYVAATLAYSDGPQIELRQVLFGLSPAVLIEPDVDEDAGRYGFNVSSVDLDADDLVAILRLCADNIESAAAKQSSSPAATEGGER